MAARTKKSTKEAQTPLILRAHRLMEAFAKSDDERDFYLDRIEGFIVFVNLDKTEEELLILHKEIFSNSDRYCAIPKLSFFESKKIMEGFVNEKVYDIDTKEKLLDIIQSKEARENFLEFIYDSHTELDKWQQYYQERSRIRIIEWLRVNQFHFVFEEDLDLSTSIIDRLKQHLFDVKVPKDLEVARKALTTKAKSYYSSEALNPRPKRGRPPKQTQKVELEPQISSDIYTAVPQNVRTFLFTPEITSAAEVTFSSKFETGEELLAHSRQGTEDEDSDDSMTQLSKKLQTLRELSSRWMEKESDIAPPLVEDTEDSTEFGGLSETDRELFKKLEQKKSASKETIKEKKPVAKKAATPKKPKAKAPAKPKKQAEKPAVKRIMPTQKKEKKVSASAKKPSTTKKEPAKRPMRKLKTKPKK